MPGITLSHAESQLNAWLTANEKVARGQSYSIAGRSLTRANAAEILNQITFWDRMVKRLSGGGVRVKRIVQDIDR